jgi:hypothetical protein
MIDPLDTSHLVPIAAATDCNDLHDVLMAPAQAQSGSMHLMLYIASLKEYRALSRVQAYVWLDTRDMLANALTKLEPDGSANLDELGPALTNFVCSIRSKNGSGIPRGVIPDGFMTVCFLRPFLQ